jgi:hypothetical protein
MRQLKVADKSQLLDKYFLGSILSTKILGSEKVSEKVKNFNTIIFVRKVKKIT